MTFMPARLPCKLRQRLINAAQADYLGAGTLSLSKPIANTNRETI